MGDIEMTHGLTEVAEVFARADHWWAIGGGWAIDLHLGEIGRRPHKDVDVVCLSSEADAVRRHLADWDVHRIVDGEFEPWTDEGLGGAHQAWVRPDPDARWAFEVLFEAIEGSEWRFRRNPEVTLPVADLRRTIHGVPTVDLGVALIYKAKRDDDVDLADLTACLPIMSEPTRRWLATAVASTHGPDHRWVRALR